MLCGFVLPVCKYHQLTQNAVSFVDGMQVVGDNEKLGHIHYTLTTHLKKVKARVNVYQRKVVFYWILCCNLI